MVGAGYGFQNKVRYGCGFQNKVGSRSGSNTSSDADPVLKIWSEPDTGFKTRSGQDLILKKRSDPDLVFKTSSYVFQNMVGAGCGYSLNVKISLTKVIVKY